jgi:lipopolysaccharide/colanic/teichoic acid biosynthesis glycosyltransferase
MMAMVKAKRSIDVVVASVALITTSPLFLFAAIGIKLTSAGPVFYRARRIAQDRRRMRAVSGAGADGAERRNHDGYYGREFVMYKFRTMHVSPEAGSVITARDDSRIFSFGAFLRATKIDELPQFLNVLRGDMTLVGPRPEAPEIVRGHYTADDLATLQVLPGMTSPGTIYYYTHCESMLAADTVVDDYVQRLLPAKLAVDRVYINRTTLFYDLRVIIRTFAAITARVVGSRWFPDPPELAEATISRTPRPEPVDTRAS